MKNTLFRKLHIYKQRSLKYDFSAGIVVFLVAIPLCLGIAMASDVSPFAGILSGIIGGIVVGALSGSEVSVSGPAAGMVGVVLTTLASLGSFNVFLLALFISGLLQIILGLFRAGFIADYIPSNVIQGMMCAIGLLLIIKQLPLAFTLSSNFKELADIIFDAEEGLSLTNLSLISYHINTGATLISILSLLLLIFFEKTKIKWLKSIPGPVMVVIFGAIINEWFVFTYSYLAQNGFQLVNLPEHKGFSDFISQLKSPNWSAWLNPKVYLFASMIAIVGSLESLLNITAGEKLDKLRRRACKNKELIAQGVGNSLAGLTGGIPITSVVVRTSVNVQAGSKTRLSTILHGCFILLSVFFLPDILNRIPLSSLAAILIFTGYKLTKPAVFRKIYLQGWDRFIPFMATIIGVIASNLLVGILIGLVISLFFILKTHSTTRLNIIKEIYPTGIINRLILPQQTTFLNKAPLIAELETIPRKSQLIIDARYSDYVDKEIVEFIRDYQKEQAPNRQITLNLMGFRDSYAVKNVIDFIPVTTFDVQAVLKPAQVLDILKEGNLRFLNDTGIHRNRKIEIQHTATRQHPIGVVLGCIDSRVPVETIFDMSFGDLFCIRVAGNVINEDILASMEFACAAVGAKLIVVLGHTRCGAIQATCDGVEQGHIPHLLAKIKPALEAESRTYENRNSSNYEFITNVTELNIANSLIHIYQESDILRGLIDEAQVGLMGALYDVNTGEVHFKDYTGILRYLDKKWGQALSEKIHQLIKSTKTEVEFVNL